MITFKRKGAEVEAVVRSTIPLDKCLFHFIFSTSHEYTAELLKDRLNADFRNFTDKNRDTFFAQTEYLQRQVTSRNKRIRQLLKFIRKKKLKAPKKR